MDTMLQIALDMDWRPGPYLIGHAIGELFGILSIPSVLLARRGRPLGALVWIMALLSLPYVGLFAWWLIGRRHLARRRAQHKAAADAVSERLAAQELDQPLTPPPPGLPVLRPETEGTGVFPATGGNFVDVLIDAPEVYSSLERMIVEAKHHVHLLFYIWQDDATGRRFLHLLIERARAGVEVRLLLDAIGSPGRTRKALRPLLEAGGKVATFLPVKLARRLTLNFRNHRKIVVVDGQVAYTGGLNIGDEYKSWHDLGIRMAGPVVDQLQKVFADDWLFATGEDVAYRPYFGRYQGPHQPGVELPTGEDPSATCAVVASGPDQRYNITHDTFIMAITEARERIWLTTPYFIPGPTLFTALRCAVYRGVDVRLLLPAKSDVPIARLAARSYYLDLLSSGIRIYEFEPAILHAKVLVFDSELSVLGSANLDTRSFHFNFEVSCFIASRATNKALAALFEKNLKESHEVRRIDVSPRRTWDRLVESTAHLLSPLL